MRLRNVFFALVAAAVGQSSDDYDEESGDDWLNVPEANYQDSYNGPLILQTIDGRLYAVDQEDGDTKWDTKLTRDWFPQYKEQKFDDFDFSFFPDPTDGSLYYFDRSKSRFTDQVLRKMGMTIPEMIESSPTKADDGKLYVGDKKDNWQVLDAITGDVIQKVDQAGGESHIIKPIPLNHEKLYVGYTIYSLTIFDTNTNEVKWNLTYSELAAKEIETYDAQITVEVCSNCGTIIARNVLDKSIKWQSNFGFPIIGVYSIYNGGLFKYPFQSFDAGYFEPFRPKDERTMQAYVGQYGQKFYVINSLAPIYMMLPDDPDKGALSSTKMLGFYPIPAPDSKPQITEEVKIHGLPDPSDCELPEHTVGTEDFGKCAAPGVPERKDPAVQEKYRINLHMQRELRRRRHKERRRNRREKQRQKRNNPKKENPIINTTSVIHATLDTFSDVKVLQSMVLIMILVLIVQFSWKNIFSGTTLRVGKIEFNPQEFLGKGCMGTSVFRGTFDGRDVAVKRLLSDSFQLADREIDMLRQAEHPNLLRYFCSEKDRQFIYIALELCEGDLDYYIENQHRFEDLTESDILVHCSAGVEQLHSLGVIHRDVKPSNILITYSNRRVARRAVIADFGLCRQVIPGRHSISVTGLHGTEGWAAPEVFHKDTSKVTYSVDIFSLGCVFYFVLSGGKHPYGHEFFMRQARIRQGRHELNNLTPLETNLILNMIQPEPKSRITIKGVQESPLFWNADKKTRFLALASDRAQIVQLDSPMLAHLAKNSKLIGGEDWRLLLDSELQIDLRKFRTYQTDIKDLLRAIRNKRHHLRDLTEGARQVLGSSSESFFSYWRSRFPNLLKITYEAVVLDFANSLDPFFSEFFDEQCAQILAHNVSKYQADILSEISEELPETKTLGSPMLPYSHKIKTKLLFQNSSPKRARPFVCPNTNDTVCNMLDGTQRIIHRDVPIRSGQDVVTFQDLCHSLPSLLTMIDAIKIESKENKRKKEEKAASTLRINNLQRKPPPPGLQEPTAYPQVPEQTFLQRGISFVRQLSTSETSESHVGRQICEQLLDDRDHNEDKENFDDLMITNSFSALRDPESDEEIICGPIGSPKYTRSIVKKRYQISDDEAVDAGDDHRPLITPEPPQGAHEFSKSSKTRRKRPTKKKKK